MSVPEPRKIDELVALYELNPELRDVYVEGESDKSLLDWFFQEGKMDGVEVAVIDTVEVPQETVGGYGFENNNRGRVIALAHELQTHLGRDCVSATCVADSDFDRALGKRYSCRLLLFTDYTSRELYFFDTRSITKVLQLAVGGFQKSARNVLTEITSALVDMFVIRMANAVLGWNVRMLPFEGCCRVVAAGVVFDSNAYIDRCLDQSQRRGEKDCFLDAVKRCRARLAADRRQNIHGHDFVVLLSWYIREHRGFRRITRPAIETSLFTSVELRQLAEQGMFRQLLRRARKGRRRKANAAT